MAGRSGLAIIDYSLAAARRFPRRLRDVHFWCIQVLIALITLFHALTELPPYSDDLAIFHHVPVTLYVIPIVYASLVYGWEGGMLTGLWVGLLSIPNIFMWHRYGAMWAGDVLKLSVVLLVGTLMSWRVADEARLRHRAEVTSRGLSISEARYRSLFENAGDAIIVFDSSDRIVSANPAASALTGYPLSELVGMSVAKLLRGDSSVQSPERSAGLSVASLGQGPVALLLQTKNGAEIHVELLPAHLPDSEGSELTQTVVRDVSAYREREMGLRSFLQQVTRAQEEERKRIARELHDDTVQTIALIRRELQEVLRLPGLGQEAASRLENAHALAGKAVEEVRWFSHDLRPPMLDDLGLVPALDAMIRDVANRMGVEVKLVVPRGHKRLDSEVELAFFRIAQEALRNVEKHAHAESVLVTLDFDDGLTQMTVQDNGKGFDLLPVTGRRASHGKLGLAGMKERASLLGAELDIQSAPGSGTSVTVKYRPGGTPLATS